jgi:hypothetical protein
VTRIVQSEFDLVSNILRRPRMYCSAETLRELLLFIEGVCCGCRPPHGSGVLDDFPRYIATRFNQTEGSNFAVILEEQYRDLPFLQASDAIHSLLKEWQSSQESSQG